MTATASSHPSDATKAAVLTPPARGAIATVSVQGPQAVACTDRYFQSLGKLRLADAPVGKILVGHWQEASEELGEELVVGKVAADEVEIHCHGGIQASARILKHLEAAGCVVQSWQERTTADAADAMVAEALQELPQAATAQAALHLLDQAQGALSGTVSEIHTRLQEANFEVAAGLVESLLSLASFGKHLTTPWSIVLAGPPNVGKSSLLNKIVGYDRAIVLDMPGTTRDVLHATTALDGWPVQFSDTAGIRVSDDALEQTGIAKAKAALKLADLVVVLHDAADLRPDELDESLQELPSALHVVNKIDLAENVTLPNSEEMLATSAVTGEGVPELISSIVRHLIPTVPHDGAAIPFTDRQIEHLQQLREAIAAADQAAAEATIRKLIDR
ncbi:GTPase [Bremerella sp. T1]|uniref:GTPase n=1 Tax=Bremerella sp. TYQ1 TaxID=3119568 RepID=UPI001CCA7B11|nr:GTPase [Bremerella volcania]UBM34341.1 50S ribosome-binding GTPase [Bremerella volcania]